MEMKSSPTPFAFEARKDNDWGDCASEYARYSEQIGFYSGITETLRKMVPPATKRLVDFGCGHGRFTRVLLNAKHVPDLRTVYLVDKFQEMLDLTTDMETIFPPIEFERVQDSEGLETLSRNLKKPVDAVACNSSLFLGRDAETFFMSATKILEQGGCLVANIPEQDFSFDDGWNCEFSKYANRAFPGSPGRQGIPPTFSNDKLAALAASCKCDFEFASGFFRVPWHDFVSFYSIPFMGARRMPNFNQRQRLEHLRAMTAAFDEIQYRWVFFKFTKQ